MGGDFYDAFGDSETCWLVVGDVCGKGAEAAALTGFLRHTTIAYARERSIPANVLLQVNRAMLKQDFEGRFATAILVRLRFTGPDIEATIANAGHPAALLARADGAVDEHSGSRDAPRCLFRSGDRGRHRHAAPAHTLALYTDGLLEARAPQQIVTAQRLIDQLAKAPPKSAHAAVDALLDSPAPRTARVTTSRSSRRAPRPERSGRFAAEAGARAGAVPSLASHPARPRLA